MRFLRSVIGYKRLDNIENKITRTQLYIYKLNDKIYFRNDWKNHIFKNVR